MKPPPDRDAVASSLTGLDDLLQHRVRVTVAVLLSSHEQLSFSRLKALLQETDGSLGAHMRRLEDADYVTVKKTFQDRRPVTWYRLTPKGRRQLTAHLEALQQLIKEAGNRSS